LNLENFNDINSIFLNNCLVCLNHTLPDYAVYTIFSIEKIKLI
jgi:hypothetical protein